MHRLTERPPQADDVQRASDLRTWLAGRSASERTTIARLWRLTGHDDDTPEALAERLLRPETVAVAVAALGPQERTALERIQAEGGRIAAPVLEREYGSIRVHSDYPNPRAYLLALSQPASPTERLYLMALVQPVGQGLQRSYAIPPDLLALLPPVHPRDRALRIATVPPPDEVVAGDLRWLERCVLAVLALAQEERLELIPSGALNKASLVRLCRVLGSEANCKDLSREGQWPYVQFLRALLGGAGLLRAGSDALLRPTRAALEWLRMPATERVRFLLDGWIAGTWDELQEMSGVELRRAFGRDLPAARRAALALLAQTPSDAWVAFNDFVAAVRLAEPDFARPDGNYDRWGVRGPRGEALDGFAHWDEVEGEQLRAILRFPLFWLGLIDLAAGLPLRYRLSPLGAALLQGAAPPPEPPPEPLVVLPQFEVLVPAYASLEARFQIGRVAELDRADTVAVYRLTERSVRMAMERGITLEDLLRFLREHSGRELPQNVVATLADWAGRHGQVALRGGVLLEARDRPLLEQILRDRRVKLPGAERLDDTRLLLREGDAPGVAERLRRAGYGLASEPELPGQPLSERDLAVLFAALEFYAKTCERLRIDSEASAALRQRVARLLPEQQLNRAFQTARQAVQTLEERLRGGRD
ncbi:MAG TPA: helicase-associated domain-containing protein [Roseiflexaceae bacterium]|nr:helicase-associated domain-containing protein [Roseiflexaceae bacterium]